MPVSRSAAAAAALALSSLLGLALAGCASRADIADGPPAAADTVTAPSVLLVSIDGFRADYLELGITPNLDRIAASGVRAQWMTPSYPSLTFPNHYTLVTGLRPDRHGIVHNTMRDEVLGEFSLRNRDAVSDGRWWGGEPLWITAERAGMPTATLFWPGSEAAIQGVRPTRWMPFDDSLPMPERVDIVLGWMSEQPSTRPRFATLYFEALDHAGHDHGPDSPQAHAAIAEVDAAIGRLLDGLEDRGVAGQVNLVVVSDHGMATVPPGASVATESMVDPGNARLVTGGQSLGFEPLPGRTRQAEAQLLGRHEGYACWRKEALPERWHYGSHPRVPSIVCQMDEGRDALPAEWLGRRPPERARGSHGFDPGLPSMRALFLAQGPAFRQGVAVPAIDNVDVYPVLARLLGVEPAPNDGDAEALAPALRAP